MKNYPKNTYPSPAQRKLKAVVEPFRVQAWLWAPLKGYKQGFFP